MRTEKQVKSQRRNFTLMYLTGVITMLRYISGGIINPHIRQHILEVCYAVEKLKCRISNLEDYYTTFYGATIPKELTTQKDVKYECEGCNR